MGFGGSIFVKKYLRSVICNQYGFVYERARRFLKNAAYLIVIILVSDPHEKHNLEDEVAPVTVLLMHLPHPQVLMMLPQVEKVVKVEKKYPNGVIPPRTWAPG